MTCAKPYPPTSPPVPPPLEVRLACERLRGKQAYAADVDALLHPSAHHGLAYLLQPRVDHLDPGVAKGAREHLHAAIMAIEADLGEKNARMGSLIAHDLWTARRQVNKAALANSRREFRKDFSSGQDWAAVGRRSPLNQRGPSRTLSNSRLARRNNSLKWWDGGF